MRERAKVNRELEVIVQRMEEAAEEPTDQSQPAPPPVEPADAPVVPNKRETPHIDEDNRARENAPVPVDLPPYQWTPPHTRDLTCSGGLTGCSSSHSTVGMSSMY